MSRKRRRKNHNSPSLDRVPVPPPEKATLPSMRTRISNCLIYLGYGLLIAWLVFILISRNPSAFVARGMLLSGFMVFGLSFVLWVWPWLLWSSDSLIGKLILTWLHAVVLWLSILYSRTLVAEILGLPPQDFEMTVTACVLLFYIPLWVCVFSVLAAFLGFIVLFFAMFAFGPFDTLVSMLYPELAAKQERFVLRGWARVLGVLGIMFVVALAWEQSLPFKKSLEPLIRGIAYVADFQEVSAYPGVDTNRRLRLHENGVVSYAEEHSPWNISISVGRVQLPCEE